MTINEQTLSAKLHHGMLVSWWGTPEGLTFTKDFRTHLAGAVISQLRNKIGEDLERDDVVAALIDTLISNTSRTHSLLEGVRNAQSPAGYLVAALVRNLSSGRTVAGIPERLDTITEEHPVRLAGTALPLTVPEIPGLAWWHFTQPRPGTLLAEAIAVTVDALMRVGASTGLNRRVLHAAVCYLAMNPEQHRGHGHTEMRNNTDLLTLGLAHSQIEVLVDICWGIRGHQRETSLLYQALKCSHCAFHSDPWTQMQLRRWAELRPAAVPALYQPRCSGGLS